jgi:hypothetical protein
MPVSTDNKSEDVSAQELTIVSAMEAAVSEALDRKRRLGQYWVSWDGEKPVKVYPENSVDSPAE